VNGKYLLFSIKTSSTEVVQRSSKLISCVTERCGVLINTPIDPGIDSQPPSGESFLKFFEAHGIPRGKHWDSI